MSEEQAKACVERLKSDEAFRARVMAEEDVDARMALISAEGFDCSAAEIGALQELADLDLSAVVGGSGSMPCGVAVPCELEERSGKLII
ncbi:MAG: Nif11-like leader peptide family RiPP precursor [Actinomycetes bacterium]